MTSIQNNPDIFFALFILIVVILIAEILSSSKWKPYYFLKGPVIFSKKIRVNSINNMPDLSKTLENKFSGTYFPSFIFKKLDRNVIAFREKLFEFVFLTYTPIMHGTLILNNDGSELIIRGRINWFPFAFTVLWLTTSPFGAFGIFSLIGLMLLLYGIQYYRFIKVGEAALNILKSNSYRKRLT